MTDGKKQIRQNENLDHPCKSSARFDHLRAASGSSEEDGKEGEYGKKLHFVCCV